MLQFMEKRNMIQRLSRITDVIRERNWDGVRESLIKLKEKVNSSEAGGRNKARKAIRSSRCIQQLSHLLNLALSSFPPTDVIHNILRIDPQLSSNYLVLTHDQIFGQTPIQIACKLWLHPDIIRVILWYDKERSACRMLDLQKRNPLYNVTKCAVSLKRNSHIVRNKETNLPAINKASINRKTYCKYLHILKTFCELAPEQIYLKDDNGVNVLHIAKLAMVKAKSRKESMNDEEYYRRVVSVCKILKKASRRVIVKFSDDDQTDAAECGSSTAWSLQMLEEQEEQSMLWRFKSAETVPFLNLSRSKKIV
mmetsp:Transcript_15529/g.18047  ORF Transcript_15529/g.18047 Transcript_15529/m.18047 type:complete len:309 (+) Transcript_15529:197-1123(+)